MIMIKIKNHAEKIYLDEFRKPGEVLVEKSI